jgi:drug/metabolite transporter (DMT)-like permease
MKKYIYLHLMLMVFSLGEVCSKLASTQEFLSVPFFLFYGLLLLSLAFYAVMWQQFLKVMPLTTAYANKSVIIIWGMIWGSVIFGEKITWNMILGALIIMIGVYLMVCEDEE